MISFKDAIKKWETPLGEVMIGYSALTRKACITPDKIFVIFFWNSDKKINEYRSFDVGLKKTKGRWTVDKIKFYDAVIIKIGAVEDSNRLGKTDIQIKYPIWIY
jgi:hypothetical protein